MAHKENERPEEVKKRGRKSTKKDENKEKAVPKKRGRRPKDKTYTILSNYKEIPQEVEDDNVILHLPDVNNNNIQVENDLSINTDGIIKYDPNINEPLPYEPLNSMQSEYALISDKMQEKIKELEENTVEETSNNINTVECKEDEGIIRKTIFEEINNNYFNVLKKAEIIKLMENDEEKSEWNMSTDVACYYCTEQFKNVPVGIPVRYVKGKFKCRDNFCSFNCAAAYIFSGFETKYYFRKWEYYSLLCLLAGQINSKIDEENNEENKNSIMRIKLADNRSLLKKFGGPLSIEKFREQFFVLDSKYNLLFPPMTCMYPQAEISQFTRVHRQKAIMLNNDNRNSISDISELRLRREIPLIQKKNTLEEYMSLKIT